MTFWEIFLIAVGLSMDAFAVSLCKGICLRKMNWRSALTAGLYFGGFQALMPAIGFFAGTRFYEVIKSIDHWIAFGLLALIGANMIRESFEKESSGDADFSWRSMLPLAVATSIDALAVGISFAVLDVQILRAVLLIGCTTFVFGAAGVYIGNRFGTRFRSRSELIGGVILILIGIRILVQHLMA